MTDSIYGYEYVVDLANSGVWGGVFILATSYLAFFFQGHQVVQLVTLALLSTSSSVAIIALYAWHIADYNNCITHSCNPSFVHLSIHLLPYIEIANLIKKKHGDE